MNKWLSQYDDWQLFEPEGEYIPPTQWGKDHWSTFAYLETRAVEAAGAIENPRMRCNPRLHRGFANITPFGSLIDGSQYPTRLKEGEIHNHDDWSCLEDMVKAGYIEAYWRDSSYGDEPFGTCRAVVVFTPLGLTVAAALRAHKAMGGNFSSFTEIEQSG